MAAKIPNSPRFHRGSNREFLIVAIISESFNINFSNAGSKYDAQNERLRTTKKSAKYS